MSPLGFKARVGSALFICFLGGKCYVHFLRSTFGATPADLLTTSITASHFPHASAEVAVGSDLNQEKYVTVLYVFKRGGC